ncbi:hypothetical protein RSOLAG22IIIB_06043 [Rhizoctonia solani]|uniref:BTB domain-containing protein n=1 Tax=Rhizoctonia solani TaxID=456999 RepID=A0A0K6GB81_9AGAM|nr:hypothetical protein RSOLAG22IIIB_06043 [Rhizoctonia solani]
MPANSSSDSEVGSSDPMLSKDEGRLAIPSRDPEYYYEDGSITFRVEDTLFKVHVTLLKLRPGDFESRLDVPSECLDITRGTCDEAPIVIPNIKASQFRNLMKVVYCPPSSKFFLSLPAITPTDIEERDAWRKFIFYLDVASLAHRFGMHDVEKWAKPRLRSLTHTAAGKISKGLDTTTGDEELELGCTDDVEDEASIIVEDDTEDSAYEDEDDDSEESEDDTDEDDKSAKAEEDAGESGDGQEHEDDGSDESDSDEDGDYCSDQVNTDDESDDDDTDDVDNAQDNSDQLVRAEDSPIFRFIDGICYAQEISDTSLLHDIRNILQCHCSDLPVDLLLSFFRAPNLCEKDPSMFGFLFLMLLEDGHMTWNRKIFTHLDRMAFFSAQCYLTPLPDSFKTPSATPLFKKIESAKKFAKRFSSKLTRTSCVQKCYREAFIFWKTQFDNGYYDEVTSSEPLIAIRCLATIPSRRLGFSEKIRSIECDHRCYLKLLGRVDRDIQGLYTRLAEYYKPIA